MTSRIEDKLKDLIVKQYGTLSNFSIESGLNSSTLTNILNRGIHNANIQNVIKICNALGISADELANDRIVFRSHSHDDEDLGDLMELLTEELRHGSGLYYRGVLLPPEVQALFLGMLEALGDYIYKVTSKSN